MTERIYCPGCRTGFLAFLEASGAKQDMNRFWSFMEIMPGVFAGSIGGLYEEEELRDWECKAEDLAELICHPVRVAVLAEHGEQIFTVTPQRSAG